MALRWKKEPNETGLRRVCQGTRGYHLRNDGERVATVATVDTYGHDKWYWYGTIGEAQVNTHASPKSLDQCKAEAYAWAKAKLAAQKRTT